MPTKTKEILDELKSVLSGSTIDAVLPPLVYVVANTIFGLEAAVLTAIVFAILLGVIRIIRKQPWGYAIGGIAGVALAAGLALITRNAASYFIPAILTSGLFVLVTVISNIIGKPLAAWLSHITRGWPLAWFWRKDVKPAYLEVTWMWGFFFAMRLSVQIFLFIQGDAATIAWMNTLLGWPVTIIILVVSYIFGIWRLRKLSGPGVDEFEDGKSPPWRGQTRGF
jgi:hypothetical protein